jgi:hypothetical protein
MKTVFLLKISIGYKKMHNFMLIPNLLKWALKNVPEKIYWQKTMRILRFLNFALFSCVSGTFY